MEGQTLVSYADFIFLEDIPRSEIAESHGWCFQFSEEFLYCLLQWLSQLTFSWEDTGVPFSPHPHQRLQLFAYLDESYLIVVRWLFIVIFLLEFAYWLVILGVYSCVCYPFVWPTSKNTCSCPFPFLMSLHAYCQVPELLVYVFVHTCAHTHTRTHTSTLLSDSLAVQKLLGSMGWCLYSFGFCCLCSWVLPEKSIYASFTTLPMYFPLVTRWFQDLGLHSWPLWVDFVLNVT